MEGGVKSAMTSLRAGSEWWRGPGGVVEGFGRAALRTQSREECWRGP